MKKFLLLLCITLIFSLLPNAWAVTWIDWQSTTSGTLTIGSTDIHVSLSGNTWDLIDGDYYYNNSYTGGTSPSGSFGGLQPTDLIRIYDVGNFTLYFDTPVINPYLALVSVGAPYADVTYSFDSPFTVLSSGPNYWGYVDYSIDGNNFTGTEFNGILQFQGIYSSFSFDVLQPEFWHGFNLGIEDVVTSPVPEPSTLLLLGSGLVGVAGLRKRKKNK